MFGKKKAAGNTVLLLDIESGSIASALIDMSGTEPRILSYQRQHMPLAQNRSAVEMTRSLEQYLDHTLRHVAEVAARMRIHAPLQSKGEISRAIIFLAAPWGMPNLNAKTPQYMPGIRQYVKEGIEAAFGTVAVSFYTSADALVFGSQTIGKHADT